MPICCILQPHLSVHYSIIDVMERKKTQLGILLIALLLAGVAPILFPVAQAGIASLSDLAVQFLIPSVILVAALIILAYASGHKEAGKQISNGLLAGMIGTIGLEIVRITGFKLGGMPGDMPKLLGVLLLDQFAQGPDLLSNVAGWAYHFWNGAAFGIIFSVLAGKGGIKPGILFGVLVGIGFMVSPVTRAMGIGMFGLQFKDGYQFILTVTLAHIAFGFILGWIMLKLNRNAPNIFMRIKKSFSGRTV